MANGSRRHPSLPGLVMPGASIADSAQQWPVTSSVRRFDSSYLSVDEDAVEDPSGTQHSRVVVRPNGAVAIVAVDDADRVLLLEQFRHPVGRRMVELPAGTLDVAGESPVTTAQRELREEGDLDAAEWESLLRLTASPGYSSELWQVFSARNLSPAPIGERNQREAEEADMQQIWVTVDEAIAAVMDARITDALTVSGLMALRRA